MYQGTSTVEGALNRLPQFTADSNENGSNGSDGTARVNLRGLGSNRVLVLIDGQRMLPVETADVNFIPSALIERVDVVTGGASAVYGSDAVAGVVNFVLEKNLQGVRIAAQYGICLAQQRQLLRALRRSTTRATSCRRARCGTADAHGLQHAMGMNSADGNGNVTFYLGYRKLEPVTQDTRDYSACGLNLTGDGNDRLRLRWLQQQPVGPLRAAGRPERQRAASTT